MILNLWVRVPLISAFAITATFFLFTLMHQLILSDFAGLKEISDPVRFDFVRIEKRDIEKPKRKLPDKNKPPEKPNIPENRMESEQLNPGSMRFSSANAVPYKLDFKSGGLSTGWAGTRDPLPIMRVTPIYPTRASRRGIEGWAEVQFTINTNGGTENVKVVAEEPSGVFGRAAVKAVRKWKYKPQMIDGEVKPRPNVRVLLKFELEK